MQTYKDESGCKIVVSKTTTGNGYVAHRQRGMGGRPRRIISTRLPIRGTILAAQMDLDQYAKMKGWEPWESNKKQEAV